eukprot:791500-Pelagomonas_calceolata.AAC.6
MADQLTRTAVHVRSGQLYMASSSSSMGTCTHKACPVGMKRPWRRTIRTRMRHTYTDRTPAHIGWLASQPCAGLQASCNPVLAMEFASLRGHDVLPMPELCCDAWGEGGERMGRRPA